MIAMAEVNLDEADAGRTRSARPGDVVRVRLGEIPTSGYRWQVVEVDAAVLTPAGDRFLPPTGTARGGQGTRELRFAVTGPGRALVRLALRRAWERTDSAPRWYEVTIDAAATR